MTNDKQILQTLVESLEKSPQEYLTLIENDSDKLIPWVNSIFYTLKTRHPGLMQRYKNVILESASLSLLEIFCQNPEWIDDFAQPRRKFTKLGENYPDLKNLAKIFYAERSEHNLKSFVMECMPPKHFGENSVYELFLNGHTDLDVELNYGQIINSIAKLSKNRIVPAEKKVSVLFNLLESQSYLDEIDSDSPNETINSFDETEIEGYQVNRQSTYFNGGLELYVMTSDDNNTSRIILVDAVQLKVVQHIYKDNFKGAIDLGNLIHTLLNAVCNDLPDNQEIYKIVDQVNN
jgi:hypothetical protein